MVDVSAIYRCLPYRAFSDISINKFTVRISSEKQHKLVFIIIIKQCRGQLYFMQTLSCPERCVSRSRLTGPLGGHSAARGHVSGSGRGRN